MIIILDDRPHNVIFSDEPSNPITIYDENGFIVWLSDERISALLSTKSIMEKIFDADNSYDYSKAAKKLSNEYNDDLVILNKVHDELTDKQDDLLNSFDEKAARAASEFGGSLVGTVAGVALLGLTTGGAGIAVYAAAVIGSFFTGLGLAASENNQKTAAALLTGAVDSIEAGLNLERGIPRAIEIIESIASDTPIHLEELEELESILVNSNGYFEFSKGLMKLVKHVSPSNDVEEVTNFALNALESFSERIIKGAKVVNIAVDAVNLATNMLVGTFTINQTEDLIQEFERLLGKEAEPIGIDGSAPFLSEDDINQSLRDAEILSLLGTVSPDNILAPNQRKQIYSGRGDDLILLPSGEGTYFNDTIYGGQGDYDQVSIPVDLDDVVIIKSPDGGIDIGFKEGGTTRIYGVEVGYFNGEIVDFEYDFRLFTTSTNGGTSEWSGSFGKFIELSDVGGRALTISQEGYLEVPDEKTLHKSIVLPGYQWYGSRYDYLYTVDLIRIPINQDVEREDIEDSFIEKGHVLNGAISGLENVPGFGHAALMGSIYLKLSRGEFEEGYDPPDDIDGSNVFVQNLGFYGSFIDTALAPDGELFALVSVVSSYAHPSLENGVHIIRLPLLNGTTEKFVGKHIVELNIEEFSPDSAISFSSDGTLFFSKKEGGEIFEVDQFTGEIEIVGSLGYNFDDFIVFGNREQLIESLERAASIDQLKPQIFDELPVAPLDELPVAPQVESTDDETSGAEDVAGKDYSEEYKFFHPTEAEVPIAPQVGSPLEANQPSQQADIMSGTAENEMMLGLGGNDTMRAGGGDDTVRGGNGEDRMFGQGGDDRLFGEGGSDFVKGGGGADLMRGGVGSDTLVGGGGADSLRGNGGDNDLRGGGGADDIKGGGGSDRITGNGGADNINGGGGHDIIFGGRGADTLKGGGGADTFQFRRGDGADKINGFQQGRDLIEITSGATGFDDLAISQDGGRVLIEVANVEITITNARIGQFSEDDFLFS